VRGRFHRRGSRWRGAILPLLPLAAITSCGGSGESQDAAAAPLLLVEELRIGEVDGGPAAFGRIMAIEADAGGNLYVADELANEIRVFAPDGTHLRSFGRQGGGPGEFRMISGMAWDAAGRLRVMDPRTRRLSTIDTGGGFHGAQTRDHSSSLTIPWQGTVDAEGRVYDLSALPGGGGSEVSPSGIVRYRVEGDRLVGTDTFRLPATRRERVEARRAPGVVERVSVPFAPGDRWRLAPDGSVWIGSTGTYRLARVTFAGDTLARLTHDRPPVPVTPAERDSAAAADGVPADRVPAVKPAFHSFFVDDEGRVWVAPHVPGGGASTWDVFGPTGSFLGTVHTPLRLETEQPSPVVRRDALYAMVRDDMDVPYVVRLRVPPFR
jgi:hypothetical protein